jgi:soluble lytic murein transglycosylase
MPYTAPDNSLPKGLVLGLMRQESSFNSDAISSSNAIGLMQLKPSTAGDMVRQAGVPSSAATASGLHDPDNNMRLGTAYLTHLQDRFGSVVPYLAAAYNGGPTRLSRWLTSAGDPGRSGGSQSDMIDWIETIPFSETRNYVQRVWENMIIYAALGQKT